MKLGVAARLVPERQRQALKRVSTLPFRSDLDRLARAYGADKALGEHGYTPMYLRHLPPRRDVRCLLEIGIGGVTSGWGYETLHGGASLRVWQDYFPKAKIVGLDIYAKSVTGPRIVTEQGNQEDAVFLAQAVRRHGPFDVIIDDGSHIGRHQRASYEALFSALRPGGVYAIEDLATIYDAEFEGGPPGAPDTAATLLKAAIDVVLRRHWNAGPDVPALDELHVYDEIAFLVRSNHTGRYP